MMFTRRIRTFIQQLRHKKYRSKHQCFVVEGSKSVNEFLKSNFVPCYILVTPHFIAKQPQLLQCYPSTIHLVTSAVLAQVGSLTTNRDILAVFPYKEPAPLSLNPTVRILVLDNLQDPGNLGTIIRAADWYGISHIVASPNTVDCYNPKVIQASMGSFGHINLHYMPLLPYLKQAQAQKIPIIGALLRGKNLHSHPLPLAGSLIIGNETQGISPAFLPFLSLAITIPRFGSAESLNAAMAVTVLCDRWTQQTSQES